MSPSNLLSQFDNKFRPVSIKFFGTYAKNLSRLTGDGLGRSRETLAKIYGYNNSQELMQELEQPGVPGPFDDDIPVKEYNTEEIRNAIEDRNARAMHLVLEANKERYDRGAPRPTLLQFYILQLFSTPKVHFAGFRQLSLPKTTAAQRFQERQKYGPNPVPQLENEERGWGTGSANKRKTPEPETVRVVPGLTGKSEVTVVIKQKRVRQLDKPYDVLDY